MKIERRNGYLFKNFKVVHKLGKGSYCLFYEAKCKRSQQHLAVKVVRFATYPEGTYATRRSSEVLNFDEVKKSIDSKPERSKWFLHALAARRKLEHETVNGLEKANVSSMDEIRQELKTEKKFIASFDEIEKEVKHTRKADRLEDRPSWSVRLLDYWSEGEGEEAVAVLAFERLTGDYFTQVMDRFSCSKPPFDGYRGRVLNDTSSKDEPDRMEILAKLHDIGRAHLFVQKRDVQYVDFSAQNVFITWDAKNQTYNIVLGDLGKATSMTPNLQTTYVGHHSRDHHPLRKFLESIVLMHIGSGSFDEVRSIVFSVIDRLQQYSTQKAKESKKKKKKKKNGKKKPKKKKKNPQQEEEELEVDGEGEGDEGETMKEAIVDKDLWVECMNFLLDEIGKRCDLCFVPKVFRKYFEKKLESFDKKWKKLREKTILQQSQIELQQSQIESLQKKVADQDETIKKQNETIKEQEDTIHNLQLDIIGLRNDLNELKKERKSFGFL